MRVLWITNMLMPPLCEALNLKESIVSGSWMYAAAERLSKTESINLAIATVYNGRDFIEKRIDNILYYLLPTNQNLYKYNSHLEKYWIQIQQEFKADVIHIHGTEYPYGLAYIRACGNSNVVISIQGLVSVIANYYYSQISFLDIIKNITFRDIVKVDTIFHQKYKFYKRGRLEIEYINLVNNVIGRTLWDKDHVFSINDKVTYFHCNETLRTVFYDKVWSYDTCIKHRIFLSQAGYTIKGLHQVIKALSLIKKKYPDSHLVVAGPNLVSDVTLIDRLRRSGYGKYILYLLRKYDLVNSITFTGPLTAKQMCDNYLLSNVFVCPSVIENSPNSLGEAQVLGVPIVASYVGGIPDLVKNGEDGFLYRFEEVKMLAARVCDIFQMKENVIMNREASLLRHDPVNNNISLCKVYEKILDRNESK